VILATPGGRNVEVRSADFSGFARIPAPGSADASSTPGDLRGIPAVAAAIRVAAQGIGELELAVWRGAPIRERVTSTWQARLFAGAPNPVQSSFQFLEAVQESIDARGNAYIWREPDSRGVVREWWALHPDQVRWVTSTGGRDVSWDVTLGRDWVDPTGAGRHRTIRVGRESILHIPGHGGGGGLQAPSPLARHRAQFQLMMDKLRHEQALWRRGGSIGLAVIAPEKMSPNQATGWRQKWEETYSGPGNAGKVALLGGGFQIQRIGLTQADAQWAEMMAFTVDDVARIIGVQASLIGGGRTDKPLTPEHEHDRWWRFGLGPRAARIVSALYADPILFGGRDRPGFVTDGIIRGDVLAEAEAEVKRVQAGIDLADEARARRGKPPLPDGLGQIPQITPVGGAPNPTASTPARDPYADPDADDSTT